jgi:hypothetical protein
LSRLLKGMTPHQRALKKTDIASQCRVLLRQTPVGQQLLQPTIPALHPSQPPLRAYLQAAVLRYQPVKHGNTDPTFTAQSLRLHPSLVLLQSPDDLLFPVQALFHTLSSIYITKELRSVLTAGDSWSRSTIPCSEAPHAPNPWHVNSTTSLGRSSRC